MTSGRAGDRLSDEGDTMHHFEHQSAAKKCDHEVLVPIDGSAIWKQRVVNGPMRTTCGRCGKQLKYSAETDVFHRGQR